MIKNNQTFFMQCPASVRTHKDVIVHQSHSFEADLGMGNKNQSSRTENAMEQSVLFHENQGIAYITLNRPAP